MEGRQASCMGCNSGLHLSWFLVETLARKAGAAAELAPHVK